MKKKIFAWMMILIGMGLYAFNVNLSPTTKTAVEPVKSKTNTPPKIEYKNYKLGDVISRKEILFEPLYMKKYKVDFLAEFGHNENVLFLFKDYFYKQNNYIYKTYKLEAYRLKDYKQYFSLDNIGYDNILKCYQQLVNVNDDLLLLISEKYDLYYFYRRTKSYSFKGMFVNNIYQINIKNLYKPEIKKSFFTYLSIDEEYFPSRKKSMKYKTDQFDYTISYSFNLLRDKKFLPPIIFYNYINIDDKYDRFFYKKQNKKCYDLRESFEKLRKRQKFESIIIYRVLSDKNLVYYFTNKGLFVFKENNAKLQFYYFHPLHLKVELNKNPYIDHMSYDKGLKCINQHRPVYEVIMSNDKKYFYILTEYNLYIIEKKWVNHEKVIGVVPVGNAISMLVDEKNKNVYVSAKDHFYNISIFNRKEPEISYGLEFKDKRLIGTRLLKFSRDKNYFYALDEDKNTIYKVHIKSRTIVQSKVLFDDRRKEGVNDYSKGQIVYFKVFNKRPEVLFIVKRNVSSFSIKGKNGVAYEVNEVALP
ncbi:hypothetical protein [Nautilia lithotrophica]